MKHTMNFPILDLFCGYDSENFSIILEKDSPNKNTGQFSSSQRTVLIETV